MYDFLYSFQEGGDKNVINKRKNHASQADWKLNSVARTDE